MATRSQPLPVTVEQAGVDRLQSQSEPASGAGSHRTTKTSPHRHGLLDRRRCDRPEGPGLLTPQLAQLTDAVRIDPVAMLEITLEGQILRLAVAHAEAWLHATVADDVHQGDLLG